MTTPVRLGAYERVRGGVRVRDELGRTLEVVMLAPGAARVGLFPTGRPVRYPAQAVVVHEPDGPDPEVIESHDGIVLRTAAMTARIDPRTARVDFLDADGRGFAAVTESPKTPGAGFELRMRHVAGERVYGGGSRTGSLEKTGSRMRFWNTNVSLGHTPAHDNMYVSIPFLLSVLDGAASGVFVDDPGDLAVDVAADEPDTIAWAAATGDLVYYAVAGPTPADVLARYTTLTGRTPMPPIWALGNQQSRWSYASADELLAVADAFDAHDIPCDVLHLDIDYMDGYRVFTWDPAAFPDPAGLIARLHERGLRVVAIVDPGVKVDEEYPVYRDGRDRAAFLRTLDGEVYTNAVWPGVAAFPDFADDGVRAWWGEQHRPLIEAGVDGVWCDMNEPAVMIPRGTIPSDTVHAGPPATLHGEIHNLYGMLMARATREGMLRQRPDRRPFVISRSGYAGMQREALHWTGDNSSWWEHLALAIPQLAGLGLSGVSWSGVDVGGFDGDCTPELLTRFLEFGIFQPFCRNHSSQGTRHQEPWAFGEPWTSWNRGLLRLRMRLLPYLYSRFEEAHRTGAPILRPLCYEYPGDPDSGVIDDQLLVGRDLLIAPMVKPGVEHRHVYLPAGTWSDWWSGETIIGPAHLVRRAPLGTPILFVRANAAIPLHPARMRTTQFLELELTLRVAVSLDAAPVTSRVYRDEGDGDAEGRGRSVVTDVDVAPAPGGVEIRVRTSCPPELADQAGLISVEITGWHGPAVVTVDRAPVAPTTDANGVLRISTLPAQARILVSSPG